MCITIHKYHQVASITILNLILIGIIFYCVDPIVRDNSAEALGTAWKVVSEKNIASFLTNVDAIKLSKVFK